MVLVFSVMLGMWIIYRLVNPWSVSAVDIKLLEKTGPRYYHTSELNSRQYDHVQKACCAIQQNLLPQAQIEIIAGHKAAPDNPLFYYLQAAVAYKKKDLRSALHLIDSGNSRGVLRSYATHILPPDRWQWPETGLIIHLGKDIIANSSISEADTISVLKMGQKLMWREPQDFISLMLSLDLRNHAAQKLQEFADENEDKSQALLCHNISTESKLLCQAVRMQMYLDDVFHENSSAWIIDRSSQKQNQQFKNAAMLLLLEKQAKKVDRLRRENLKAKVEDFRL